MAEEKVENPVVETPLNTEETTEEFVDLTSDKIGHAIADNGSKVLIALIVAIAFIVGFNYYQNAFVAPKTEKGLNSMYMAQYYFQIRDFDKAINGDDDANPGFEELIEEYSGTKVENLSHFYLGQIFLAKGEYETAIDHLEQFSSDDLFAGAIALSSIGDAHAELGNESKAISFYKKAASSSDNEFTAPLYTMKAGLALELSGNISEALGYYEMIKKQYPLSAQGKDIDKYIAKAKAALGK